MKKILFGLLLTVLMGISSVGAACAHVDIQDNAKAVIFDNFVQDIRDDNFVHMGDQVGLVAEMRGDVTKKRFVYFPATNTLYRIVDIQLYQVTKDYDLRWIPYLQGCYAHSKAKVEKEQSK